MFVELKHGQYVDFIQRKYNGYHTFFSGHAASCDLT